MCDFMAGAGPQVILQPSIIGIISCTYTSTPSGQVLVTQSYISSAKCAVFVAGTPFT